MKSSIAYKLLLINKLTIIHSFVEEDILIMYVIYKLSQFVKSVILKRDIFALVKPYMMHCITVWGCTNGTNFDKLRKYNWSVLKIYQTASSLQIYSKHNNMFPVDSMYRCIIVTKFFGHKNDGKSSKVHLSSPIIKNLFSVFISNNLGFLCYLGFLLDWKWL